MNISAPILELHNVNISNILTLTQELSKDEWDFWNLRQKTFGVHANTKTYPLRWAEQINENTYQIFLKNKKSIINQILLPEVSKLEKLYSGRCVNILFAKLLPHTIIHPHRDVSDLLLNIHRLHLPIITNENVDFYIHNKKYNLKEGTLYEINNALAHSVENNSSFDRVHLILDILPYSKNINLEYIFDEH